jgi:hypothetical protein
VSNDTYEREKVFQDTQVHLGFYTWNHTDFVSNNFSQIREEFNYTEQIYSDEPLVCDPPFKIVKSDAPLLLIKN